MIILRPRRLHNDSPMPPNFIPYPFIDNSIVVQEQIWNSPNAFQFKSFFVLREKRQYCPVNFVSSRTVVFLIPETERQSIVFLIEETPCKTVLVIRRHIDFVRFIARHITINSIFCIAQRLQLHAAINGIDTISLTGAINQ